VSIHIYEKRGNERVGRGRRKEAIAELLKTGISKLESHSNPWLLQVLSGPEENSESLVFVTERVLGTLSTILASQGGGRDGHRGLGSRSNSMESSCNYTLIDFEYRWGLSQITEALLFLHLNCHTLHRNVCPGTIYVTARGAWKLAGLEHSEKMGDGDGEVACTAWTTKMPKAAQPNLNYIAPEIQHKGMCNTASDMYSLGMVFIACFNSGHSLVQASHSTTHYFKLAGQLSDRVNSVLAQIPIGLQESVFHLVNQDTRHRPPARSLVQITYFGDPAVQALQFLEALDAKDTNQKAQFFRNSLLEVFAIIPKKLWLQQIWPFLQIELTKQEMMAAVLESVIFLVQESSQLEFETFLQPHTRPLFSGPKTVQASVTLLEQLPIFLEKTNKTELECDILPMLYLAMESSMSQVQMAAVSVVPTILDYLCDDVIRIELLPRARSVYLSNGGDVKIVLSLLACIAKILDKLEKCVIIDEVLPLLGEIRLNDVNILVTVLEIYRVMMSDRKYGLTMNILATRVLPVLLPQMVNPQLDMETYIVVQTTIQDMFDHIDRHQRNKLRLDGEMPKSPESYRLKYDRPTESMSIPNLVIRRPSVVQGPSPNAALKTYRLTAITSSNNSSAESSPENNNYLRVSALFGNRRWSENTISCGVNKIPVSSASSPGSCPGSPLGLPNRRHSSAHRRRSSSNLLQNNHPLPASPLGGSVPNSLGRSGSPFSSRRNSNMSNLGSQSSLYGSRKSSIAGDWRNATPPTTPSSLLQQTFNNVVSAASSFSSTNPYRRPFARNHMSESVD